MLNFKEIDIKRLKNGISRYRLCKESLIHTSNYYKLLKNNNPTSKTLEKLGLALSKIIKNKGKNAKTNGYKR